MRHRLRWIAMGSSWFGQRGCSISTSSLRSITIVVTAVAAVLALAGCLRLAVFQGVHVYPTPDVASEAFCHELHVSAEFGVHSLVDTTFTVGDADVFFFETPSAPTQPHYNGMPLAIDVECTNSSGAIVGHSEYLGRLQNSNDSAVVAVYNYSLQDDCIGPLQGTGVQVCLAGYGYDWD